MTHSVGSPNSAAAQSSPKSGEPSAAAAKPGSKPADKKVVDGPIVLVEPRNLIRECLASRIATQAELAVVTATSMEEGAELAERVSASLIVLSIANKDAEAQKNIRSLAALRNDVPTVVLADDADMSHVLNVLQEGIQGYVPMSLTFEVAVAALKLVKAGGTFAPAQSLMGAPGMAPKPRDAPETAGIFTARQAAVVQALCCGKPNKIIAYELNMRESTVKVHVRNIMKKLNARNRTEVALFATRLNQSSD